MHHTKLHGVIPPVCTPFLANFDVDTTSLRRLVDHLIDGGVHGLFALGSTSEVAFLTDAQRHTVLETIIDQARGGVPVLAGAIDMTAPRVAEHVRVAIALGVDGIVATAPFYTRTHPAEIELHYRIVKDVCGDVPLYAYDIPSAVGGTKLEPDMVLRLAAEGILAGVKDSSGIDASIRALVLGARWRSLNDFVVMTGSELTVDASLAAGANGVVPGIGNVDPHGYVRIYDHICNGDLASARTEQERLFAMFGLVGVGAPSRMGRGSSALGAFKAALAMLGHIDDARTAPPAIQLLPDEIDFIRPYLRAASLLN